MDMKRCWHLDLANLEEDKGDWGAAQSPSWGSGRGQCGRHQAQVKEALPISMPKTDDFFRIKSYKKILACVRDPPHPLFNSAKILKAHAPKIPPLLHFIEQVFRCDSISSTYRIDSVGR